MKLLHAVVWIDHSRASIIHFNAGTDRRIALVSGAGKPHLHHKQGAIGPGRAGADRDFFEAIGDALVAPSEILLVGPASAKDELAEYLARHRPQVRARIAGIETVDHPSDNQLLAYARNWYNKRVAQSKQGEGAP